MARLSVVIPTFRRPDSLPRTLDALERQAVGPDAFEVVVVDDPHEDDPDVVTRCIGSRAFGVRQLHREAPGVAAARNTGWRAAQAPLVLFLGDDILAEPDLVEQHLAWHERHPGDTVAVLGHVRWADSLEQTTFMRWLDRGWQYDYARIAGDEAGWGRLYTANVSLKRALLERSGGFDESFEFGAEDIELGRRLDDLGLRLLYNRAARAEHLHEPTLESWTDRMAIAARAEHHLHRKHPDIGPYFLPRMRRALEEPPPRGRGARLARFVSAGLPWLGPRVWASVDAEFRYALAPAFLEAWEEAERELPPEVVRERSRVRWRAAQPDVHLTFGAELSGDAFIECAQAHGVFGPDKVVLEIGPGYGRLLRSALALDVPFRRWIGVDLSEQSVEHLRASFADARTSFVVDDAETVRVDQSADALISSLTFKHLYPTFDAALANLARQLRPGAVVAIDLIEGKGSHFEDDNVTYVRRYTRDEIEAAFVRAGLELRGFDTVQHHPDLARLLAVGVRR